MTAMNGTDMLDMAKSFVSENEDGSVNEFQHYVIDRGGAFLPSNRQHWRHSARLALDKARRSISNAPTPEPVEKKKRKAHSLPQSPDPHAQPPINPEFSFNIPEPVEFFEPNPDCRAEFMAKVKSHLQPPSFPRSNKIILLQGLPRYGKTALINSVLSELNVAAVRLSTDEFATLEDKKRLQFLKVLKAAKAFMAPCAIILDHFEEDKPRKLLKFAHFLNEVTLDTVGQQPPILFVAESTQRRFDFDESVAKMLTSAVEMGFYLKSARARILRHLLFPDSLTSTECGGRCLDANLPFEELVVSTHGYSYDNLHDLCVEMVAHAAAAVTTSSLEDAAVPLVLTRESMEHALKWVVPITRGSAHFASVPDITMDMIGGLQEAKALVEQKFLKRIRRFQEGESVAPAPPGAAPQQAALSLAAVYSRTKPSGIVLYGPPGCGKTLLAKAISHAGGLNFMYINSPEVFNKYVGESERALRRIFADARLNAPCVIFFDEFDSIAGRRESDNSRVYTGVVDTLLNEVDGLMSHRSNIHVYCMAATNRLDALEPAVIRSGRFGTHIHVTPPASVEERADVLVGYSRALGLLTATMRLHEENSWRELFRKVATDGRTENLSGADMKQILDEALELDEPITEALMFRALESMLRNRSQ